MVYFHEKSQQAVFMQGDFRQTFLLAKPGDIVYCDPPYVPLSASSNFSAYTHQVFGEKEQIELAELAKLSMRDGITVVISNHDTPFTRHHYQQGEIISFPVRRQISCQAMNRQYVQELVAIFRT